jgi:3-dehydroquinate dehydratase I
MRDSLPTGRICVAIGENSPAAVLAVARKVSPLADVVEIRLDCLAEPAVSPFLRELQLPLLFTNRPVWEGGFFSGEEAQRISLLLQAFAGGAAYVDLELQAPKSSHRLIAAARKNSRTKLILSHHNFTETPQRQELLDTLHAMHERGGDIGKIITMAGSYKDVLRVLQLQEDAEHIQFPLIAFCMGQAGMISRLATLELGGYMTYCAPDQFAGTAPGQIAITNMREILHCLGIRTE